MALVVPEARRGWVEAHAHKEVYMRRRLVTAVIAGALTAIGLTTGASAQEPAPISRDAVTITTTMVDRAGNAIIDFEMTCNESMAFEYWSVAVDQYGKKGAQAHGVARSVQAYVCIPGQTTAPYDGDQDVVNGALLIRPGSREGFPSGPFTTGYATVSINVGWILCPGAVDMEACWAILQANPDQPGDTFWKYQTVKLSRAR